MALKISSSNLMTNRYLIVESDGIRYRETSFMGGVRRFRFSDIDCILMAPDNTFSFQVGQEVFSIATKPANAKHQAVITAFVNEVRRTGAAGTETS